MSATKILWGQIASVLTIVLIMTWAATQWTAWRLGYQPQLGHPWFELLPGIPVYLPPAFFWWWYAYDAYAPDVFVEGACVAASGGIISIIAAFAMSVWRAREAETAATYGSARWANQIEIRGAGLAGPDGVVLGRFWLTATPPLPDTAQPAAQTKGRERYEGFVEVLGRRLARGQTLAQEISLDIDTAKASPIVPQE